MSQTKKFKSDRKYGHLAEHLTASRLVAKCGVAANDHRLIAETSTTEIWELDTSGRILIPIEWEWDNGSYLRSPLLDAKSVPEADLTCISLSSGGYIEAPTTALGRLVRRAHREANEDELLSSFELIAEINGDSQQTSLAIPLSELLSMTGIAGLQNTLVMLANRVQEANLDSDPGSPIMSRPTMVSLPPDAWHTLPFDYPMATRPAAETSKEFDLFVITRLDSDGAIKQTTAAEVKADRRYFASGNVFVELSHKDRASGVMATTADLFVLVFGGVSVTLPTAWLRSRVASIVAAAGPERMRTNTSDDGLVKGILVRPEELLLSSLTEWAGAGTSDPLGKSSSSGLIKSGQPRATSQRLEELVPF